VGLDYLGKRSRGDKERDIYKDRQIVRDREIYIYILRENEKRENREIYL
jgi:hypothetical protein